MKTNKPKKVCLAILLLLAAISPALAISDEAYIDWDSPIVEAGRTGCVYPIRYTKTAPSASGEWQQLSFDDSSWSEGFGPIANTGFGGTLGTTFDDVNDGEYNVWFRRTFTSTSTASSSSVGETCGTPRNASSSRRSRRAI